MLFSSEEKRAVVVLGIVAGIIVSFRQLFIFRAGHLVIESTGIFVFLVCVLGMILSAYIHEAGVGAVVQ